jgi:hypothetical protein
MRLFLKPRLEGRKVTESVMFADIDIVSRTVLWTRHRFREPPPGLSSLNDGSHNESISPDEQVRGDRGKI